MRKSTRMIFILCVLFLFSVTVAMAQEETEDNKTGPTEDSLDSMLKAPPVQKKQEPKDEKAVAEPPKPEQVFPVDERKIRVTVKMKNGKTIKGVVKNFLVSEKIIDHLAEPTFNLLDGPTVRYERDEFVLDWKDVKSVVFNKKNKENGEISCVEVSDISPDRLECVMMNEYIAFNKDPKKKGEHVILNKDMFRFVIDTGKEVVKIDSHMGKVKITNERDEERRDKDLVKELKDVFRDGILSITFQ